MNNKFEKLALFLSLIALVVSLAIVCVWIFSVEKLSVVNSDTFMSAIIAVLGVLFTILMGWNIYSVIDVRQHKEDMNKTLEKINNKVTSFDGSIKQQTDLADAYAYHGLAEVYLGQKRYVSSYLKYISAALYFEKAKEHNLALHSLGRIYTLIRELIRNNGDNKVSYVLDYDMYDNLSYNKDRAELVMLKISEYDVEEIHKTFMHYLTMYAKHIKIEDTDFTLYSYDADIKQRPIAIYLLMKDEKYICKTMLYDEYLGILQCELKLNHNIVAIAEFTSLDECKEVYDKIDAKIIKKGIINTQS